MVVSLSTSSSNSTIAASLSSSGMLSRRSCRESKKSCVMRPNVPVTSRMASKSAGPAQSLCSRFIQYFNADLSVSYVLIRLF
ncbi:hypothetical protein T10_13255 [Trichinella papuae]|uniref:Uncharacterized protein n=1 Tax=Trichinella papuae TaxID=268474 RepID=A0A0V1M1X2_9BILA|nr:hypothetical protein T10_13255 [Trichinella papuae]